jgi:hypothetical protein
MKFVPEKIHVEGINELEWDAIVRPWPDRGTLYVYYVGRKMLGINWSRDESWDDLGRPAKRAGATHNGRYWEFPQGARGVFPSKEVPTAGYESRAA